MRALLIPLVLLVVIGRDAFGQLIQSAPITTQECSRQASAIGPSDRTALGWSRLPDCGTTGGTALANALSAARSSADSIYLYSLLVVASRIQNPTLLLTAQTVAEDRSAADPPRIIAILIALAQIDNHNTLSIGLTWDRTVRQPWGLSCRLTPDLDAQYASTTALPSNAAAQLGTRLDGIIFATPPNSHAVIDVAKCVRAALVAADAGLSGPGADCLRLRVRQHLPGIQLFTQVDRRELLRLAFEREGRPRSRAELVATVRGRCQGHRAVGLPRSDDPAGGKWRDDLPSVIRWRQTDKPNLNQFRRPNAPPNQRGVSFCDLSQPANSRRVGAFLKGC